MTNDGNSFKTEVKSNNKRPSKKLINLKKIELGRSLRDKIVLDRSLRDTIELDRSLRDKLV